MDINLLRHHIDSMTAEELQSFTSEAELRYGVNKLCSLPIREHLLSSATSLVDERLLALGLNPRTRHQVKPETIVHTIDRRERQHGRNGPVVIIKECLTTE